VWQVINTSLSADEALLNLLHVELNDPTEQRARFQAQLQERQGGFSDACLPDEEFCGVLEYGL
jgi:lysyl-tRNA synthetase class II